jgi:hypothetical protein
MQVISLRESAKGPGGEYILVEWRGVPDNNMTDLKDISTVIYYLNTKSQSCTVISKEEIAKFYGFLRRKEDKVMLIQASKCMM